MRPKNKCSINMNTRKTLVVQKETTIEPHHYKRWWWQAMIGFFLLSLTSTWRHSAWLLAPGSLQCSLWNPYKEQKDSIWQHIKVHILCPKYVYLIIHMWFSHLGQWLITTLYITAMQTVPDLQRHDLMIFILIIMQKQHIFSKF